MIFRIKVSRFKFQIANSRAFLVKACDPGFITPLSLISWDLVIRFGILVFSPWDFYHSWLTIFSRVFTGIIVDLPASDISLKYFRYVICLFENLPPTAS